MRVLIFLLFIASSINLLASTGRFDALRLIPSSLPSDAPESELRVDSDDENILKKFNSTEGVWEQIAGAGGGGGGGINLLQEENFDFEDSPLTNEWTFSGSGSFSAETTDPMFEDQSGLVDFSASGETLDSAEVTIEKGFVGQRCEIVLPYKFAGGTEGNVTLQAIDSTPNVLAEIDLAPTTGDDVLNAQMMFDCPDTFGETLRLRLNSTADAQPVTLDNAFLGIGRLIGQAVPGNKLIGEKILSSNVTSDGVVSELTFDSTDGIKTGQFYTVILGCSLKVNDAGVADPAVDLTVINSTSDEGRCLLRDNETSTNQTDGTNVFTFKTNSDSITFNAVSASADSFVRGDGTKFGTWARVIERNDINANPKENITLETSGFLISADIIGTFDLNGSSTSGFIEMTDPGASLNQDSESNEVDIACSGTNSSTGDTCSSGDESNGIVFEAPTAGIYQICTGFQQQIRLGTSTDRDFSVRYSIAHTENASQTIIERSPQRSISREVDDADELHNEIISLCETFRFNSAQKKTFRLMIKREFTENINGAALEETKWRVFKLNEGFPTPVFTDLQNSLSSKLEAGTDLNTASGLIGCSPSPTVNNDLTQNISSVTHDATGVCTVTFDSGTFSDNVICSGSHRGTGVRTPSFNTIGPGSIEVHLNDESGTKADGAFIFTCLGPK